MGDVVKADDINTHSKREFKFLQTIETNHEVFYLEEELFIVISIFINKSND